MHLGLLLGVGAHMQVGVGFVNGLVRGCWLVFPMQAHHLHATMVPLCSLQVLCASRRATFSPCSDQIW